MELEASNSSTSTQRLLRQQLDQRVELGRRLLEVRERALVVPRSDVRAAAVALAEHRLCDETPSARRPRDGVALDEDLKDAARRTSFTRSFASLYVSAYSIAAPMKSSPQSFSNFWKVMNDTAIGSLPACTAS